MVHSCAFRLAQSLPSRSLTAFDSTRLAQALGFARAFAADTAASISSRRRPSLISLDVVETTNAPICDRVAASRCLPASVLCICRTAASTMRNSSPTRRCSTSSGPISISVTFLDACCFHLDWGLRARFARGVSLRGDRRLQFPMARLSTAATASSAVNGPLMPRCFERSSRATNFDERGKGQSSQAARAYARETHTITHNTDPGARLMGLDLKERANPWRGVLHMLGRVPI